MAYGGAQARGQIRTAAAATAMRDPSRIFQSSTSTTAQGNTGSLTRCTQARDQTHVLMDSSRILNSLSHMGMLQGERHIWIHFGKWSVNTSLSLLFQHLKG